MAFSAPAQWQVRTLHFNKPSRLVHTGTHGECCSFLARNKQQYRFSSESGDTQTIFVRERVEDQPEA